MKKIYFFGLLTFVVCTGFLALTVKPSNQRFNESRTNIIFRKVGHRLLLQAGDSTSRVLPVEKIDENEYRIRFESPFTFVPDSLIHIVQETVSVNGLPLDYIVSVVECGNMGVVFGYAMLNAEHRSIVPCTDRQSPKNCYSLIIQFKEEEPANRLPVYVAGGAMLVFAGLYFRRRNKKNFLPEKVPPTQSVQSIGRFRFYATDMSLELDGTRILLSTKECKLLSIFAKKINEIVERASLQKEVWEDEGVIVGRSLDMYISKLRKKLEGDPNVKLVNIHGRGYKLETT